MKKQFQIVQGPSDMAIAKSMYATSAQRQVLAVEFTVEAPHSSGSAVGWRLPAAIQEQSREDGSGHRFCLKIYAMDTVPELGVVEGKLFGVYFDTMRRTGHLIVE